MAASPQGSRRARGGVLAAIRRAELPREIKPGERVTLEARVVTGFGALFLVEGKAVAGGEVIAQAELTLAVGITPLNPPLSGGKLKPLP